MYLVLIKMLKINFGGIGWIYVYKLNVVMEILDEWIIKINVLGKVKCILCIKILLYGLKGKSVLFEYCNLRVI